MQITNIAYGLEMYAHTYIPYVETGRNDTLRHILGFLARRLIKLMTDVHEDRFMTYNKHKTNQLHLFQILLDFWHALIIMSCSPLVSDNNNKIFSNIVL